MSSRTRSSVVMCCMYESHIIEFQKSSGGRSARNVSPVRADTSSRQQAIFMITVDSRQLNINVISTTLLFTGQQ